MYYIEEPQVETTRDCSGDGGGRKEGCVYSVLPTSPFGRPLGDFMVCPTIPVSLEEFGWTANGMNIWEVDGTYHLVDVIGRQFWDVVPDYVEEGASGGFSQLVPLPVLRRFLPLRTNQSRIFAVHSRAVLKNFWTLYENLLPGTRWSDNCPLYVEQHMPDYIAEFAKTFDPTDDLTNIQKLSCLKLLWQTVNMSENDEEGSTILVKGEDGEWVKKESDRYFKRIRTIARYTAAKPPKGFTPEYDWGIFMWTPITRLEVVYDTSEMSHEGILDELNDLAGGDIEIALTAE